MQVITNDKAGLLGAARCAAAKSSNGEGGVVSAPFELRRLTTPQDLFQAAAEEVIRAATSAIAQRGRFTIALSGGSTPRNLYTLIAANASASLPWDQMFFFWGDERHVPPDDPESNYRMAKETLLSKVPIPPANIFRIPAENPDAAAAADAYEQTLRKFFARGARRVSSLRSDPAGHGTGRTCRVLVSGNRGVAGDSRGSWWPTGWRS